MPSLAELIQTHGAPQQAAPTAPRRSLAELMAAHGGPSQPVSGQVAQEAAPQEQMPQPTHVPATQQIPFPSNPQRGMVYFGHGGEARMPQGTIGTGRAIPPKQFDTFTDTAIGRAAAKYVGRPAWRYAEWASEQLPEGLWRELPEPPKPKQGQGGSSYSRSRMFGAGTPAQPPQPQADSSRVGILEAGWEGLASGLTGRGLSDIFYGQGELPPITPDEVTVATALRTGEITPEVEAAQERLEAEAKKGERDYGFLAKLSNTVGTIIGTAPEFAAGFAAGTPGGPPAQLALGMASVGATQRAMDPEATAQEIATDAVKSGAVGLAAGLAMVPFGPNAPKIMAQMAKDGGSQANRVITQEMAKQLFARPLAGAGGATLAQGAVEGRVPTMEEFLFTSILFGGMGAFGGARNYKGLRKMRQYVRDNAEHVESVRRWYASQRTQTPEEAFDAMFRAAEALGASADDAFRAASMARAQFERSRPKPTSAMPPEGLPAPPGAAASSQQAQPRPGQPPRPAPVQPQPQARPTTPAPAPTVPATAAPPSAPVPPPAKPTGPLTSTELAALVAERQIKGERLTRGDVFDVVQRGSREKQAEWREQVEQEVERLVANPAVMATEPGTAAREMVRLQREVEGLTTIVEFGRSTGADTAQAEQALARAQKHLNWLTRQQGQVQATATAPATAAPPEPVQGELPILPPSRVPEQGPRVRRTMPAERKPTEPARTAAEAEAETLFNQGAEPPRSAGTPESTPRPAEAPVPAAPEAPRAVSKSSFPAYIEENFPDVRGLFKYKAEMVRAFRADNQPDMPGQTKQLPGGGTRSYDGYSPELIQTWAEAQRQKAAAAQPTAQPPRPAPAPPQPQPPAAPTAGVPATAPPPTAPTQPRPTAKPPAEPVPTQRPEEVAPRPTASVRSDLLPPEWRVEVRKGAPDEGRVDWQTKTLVYSDQKYASDPSIVNHEIAHVATELHPESKSLLREYVDIMRETPYWKEHGADWIVKNLYHHEQIAMDLGKYLSGERIFHNERLSTPESARQLEALFDRYFGQQPPRPAEPAPRPEGKPVVDPAVQEAALLKRIEAVEKRRESLTTEKGRQAAEKKIAELWREVDALRQQGEAKPKGPQEASLGWAQDMADAARAGQRFAQDVYVKAKPQLEAAWRAARDTGKSAAEWVRDMVRMFGKAVTPYARKAVQEAQRVMKEQRGAILDPREAVRLLIQAGPASKWYRQGIRNGYFTGQVDMVRLHRTLARYAQERVQDYKRLSIALERATGVRTPKEQDRFVRAINRLEEFERHLAARERLKRLVGADIKLPEDLKQRADALLGTFSMTKVQQETIDRANELIRLDQADPYGRIPLELVEHAKQVLEDAGKGWSLQDMTADEINEVANAIETIQGIARLRAASKQRREELVVERMVTGAANNVKQRATTVVENAPQVPKPVRDMAGNLAKWDQMNLMTLAHYLGGYDGPVYEVLYTDVQDSLQKHTGLTLDEMEAFQAQLAKAGLTPDKMRTWYGPERVYETVDMPDAGKIPMTKDEMAGLYLSIRDASTRTELLRHKGADYTFRDRAGAPKTYKLTGADLVYFMDNMPPDVQALADIISARVQRLGEMADAHFEARTGAKITTGRDDHWPRERERPKTPKEAFGPPMRTYEGLGIYKERSESSLPIIIKGALEVYTSHAKRVLGTVAKAEAMQNAMLLITSQPFRDAVLGAHPRGQKILKNLERYIRHINGLEVPHDYGEIAKMTKRALNNLGPAKLIGRITVPLYQPVSLLVAAGEMGYSGLVKGAGSAMRPSRRAEIIKEMRQVAPDLYMRMTGGNPQLIFNPAGQSDSIGLWIGKDPEGIMYQGMRPIHFMDRNAIMAIWERAWQEAHKQKLSEQEALTYVGRRASDVVYRTQINTNPAATNMYTLNAREGGFSMLWTPFTGQPQQNFNYIARAWSEFRHNPTKENRNKFVESIVVSLIGTSVVIEAIRSGVDWLFEGAGEAITGTAADKKRKQQRVAKGALNLVNRVMGNLIGPIGDTVGGGIEALTAGLMDMPAYEQNNLYMAWVADLGKMFESIGMGIANIGEEYQSGPNKGENKFWVEMIKAIRAMMRLADIARLPGSTADYYMKKLVPNLEGLIAPGGGGRGGGGSRPRIR